MQWIEGNTYPLESGFYLAKFKKSGIRRAYFTLVTTPFRGRKTYGKWGTVRAGEYNYVPLIDPIEWLKGSHELSI